MDFGNSDAKWATGEELTRNRVQRAPSRDSARLISQLQALPKPSRVHIATVLRADRLHELLDWMASNWGIDPVFAQTRRQELGVVNGYDTPDQLGVDRWLGLLAARAISKRHLLVVDCGTATTLDAMDMEGRHLGGVILPGLALFGRCLHSQTDLPTLDSTDAVGGFATDTAAGIASGAMLATTASIETMLERMRARGRHPVDCLLTGGFAGRVADHLDSPCRQVPDLILQGLCLQAGQADRQ